MRMHLQISNLLTPPPPPIYKLQLSAAINRNNVPFENRNLNANGERPTYNSTAKCIQTIVIV